MDYDDGSRPGDRTNKWSHCNVLDLKKYIGSLGGRCNTRINLSPLVRSALCNYK